MNGKMPTALVSTDAIEDLTRNREKFLKHFAITPEQTTQVRVTFDAEHYRRYRVADADEKGAGLTKTYPEPADALVTAVPGHALILPLADCVGAILYDARQKILMVSHLGRHSTEEMGAQHSVEFLHKHYGTAPSDILVWLSPAVGEAQYPLRAFEGRGLQEVNIEQFLSSGIIPEHLEIASVNTAEHDDYYSHSEFLKGDNHKHGRFAIVAMMRERGEPAS